MFMLHFFVYSNELDSDSDANGPSAQPSHRDSSMSFAHLPYHDRNESSSRMTVAADRDSHHLETSADQSGFMHDEAAQPAGSVYKHSLSTELALVVDGSTLENIWHDDISLEMFRDLVRDMSTVIACRVSPLQKASLVRMIKTGKGKPVTLAIGDGANDIGMINEAKVGVGICGN